MLLHHRHFVVVLARRSLAFEDLDGEFEDVAVFGVNMRGWKKKSASTRNEGRIQWIRHFPAQERGSALTNNKDTVFWPF